VPIHGGNAVILSGAKDLLWENAVILSGAKDLPDTLKSILMKSLK
jgi:hypothetical protein